MKPPTNAAEIHRHFSKLPGSERIATEHAIAGLIQWLDRKKPKVVLEIGAGIGTLTYAVLRTVETFPHSTQMVTFEDNAFCIEQMRNNLREFEGRYQHIDQLDQLNSALESCDFLLIDGGNLDEAFFEKLAPGGTIFVEGLRKKQRKVLEKLHGHRKWSSANYIKASLKHRGGFWVYQFEPNMRETLILKTMHLVCRVIGSLKWRFKKKAA